MAVYQYYSLLEYDPIKDFKSVAQIAAFEFGIAVGNDIPAKTLQELVAWIRANPSRANYGIPGAGTLPHFLASCSAGQLESIYNPISYKGGSFHLSKGGKKALGTAVRPTFDAAIEWTAV